MYDKELVRETIQLLEKTLEILLKRVSGITSVHDFLDTENGVILLDSVCMKLIAVGESVKNLDKIMDKRIVSELSCCELERRYGNERYYLN